VSCVAFMGLKANVLPLVGLMSGRKTVCVTRRHHRPAQRTGVTKNGQGKHRCSSLLVKDASAKQPTCGVSWTDDAWTFQDVIAGASISEARKAWREDLALLLKPIAGNHAFHGASQHISYVLLSLLYQL